MGYFLFHSYIFFLGVFQELRIKPCPVVFVGLSAGTKACMYKVFQVSFVNIRYTDFFLVLIS